MQCRPHQHHFGDPPRLETIQDLMSEDQYTKLNMEALMQYTRLWIVTRGLEAVVKSSLQQYLDIRADALRRWRDACPDTQQPRSVGRELLRLEYSGGNGPAASFDVAIARRAKTATALLHRQRHPALAHR